MLLFSVFLGCYCFPLRSRCCFRPIYLFINFYFCQVCAASGQQKMLQDLGAASADLFNYSKTCTLCVYSVSIDLFFKY